MTEPYYQDEMVTIYHGDCAEIVPELGRFDLLLTDIPYGEVNRGDSGLRNLDKGVADVADFNIAELAGMLSGLAGSAYVFCGTEQVSAIRECFVRAGMSTRVGVWEKTNPSPMNGQHLWLSGIELCVYGKHPKAPFFAHMENTVWRGPIESKQYHPTQKPDWLFAKLLHASCPGDGSTLDPFMGSGTTLVAARRNGIRSVGIDREEKYCEIAARRVSQMSLFEGAA